MAGAATVPTKSHVKAKSKVTKINSNKQTEAVMLHMAANVLQLQLAVISIEEWTAVSGGEQPVQVLQGFDGAPTWHVTSSSGQWALVGVSGRLMAVSWAMLKLRLQQ